jgi:hypothetical protein
MHEICVAGPRGRDRNVVGPMKSVPITIKLCVYYVQDANYDPWSDF